MAALHSTTVTQANRSDWASDGPENSTLVSGNWRGESVRIAAASDPLADAAEELSRDIGQTHTSRRRLDQRDIRPRTPLRVPPIERISSYLREVGKQDKQATFRHFLDALKERARYGSSSQAGDLARRSFADPTERFLALSYAIGQLESEGEEANAALLRELQSGLEREQDDTGGHILADLNTSAVASEFGHGQAEPVACFQAVYRDAVLGRDGLPELLRGTLERFGEADYAAAIASLIRALGADLAAIQGSAPVERLQAVLQELYLLEALAAGLDQCQTLAGRMLRRFNMSLTPGALLSDLVDLSVMRWISAAQFQSIADKFHARTVDTRIALLAGAKNALRMLPTKIFADMETRANALDAAQQALDVAIAMEEQ